MQARLKMSFLVGSKQPSLEKNSEQINPFLFSCPSYVPASETTALPPGDSASGPWDKGLCRVYRACG